MRFLVPELKFPLLVFRSRQMALHVKHPGIARHAQVLGVSRTLLYQCISGRKDRPEIVRRYERLLIEEAEAELRACGLDPSGIAAGDDHERLQHLRVVQAIYSGSAGRLIGGKKNAAAVVRRLSSFRVREGDSEAVTHLFSVAITEKIRKRP